MRAENVTGPVAYHAEGPCWSETWGGLRFVDMHAGDLLTLSDDGRVGRMATGSTVAAFVRPRVRGGYIVGVQRGVALSVGAHTPPSTAVVLWTDAPMRMNENGMTPEGALLGGTVQTDFLAGQAMLFRVETDLSCSVEVPGVTVSNGLAFSPDGRLAYYNDSATGRVDLFDYADGHLLNRRPFVSVASGSPDGLTVDADGNIWVALWGGSAVHGFAPDGSLIQVVEVAAVQVSACTFGGHDLGTLYITTSREGLADGADPEAGSLFSVRTGTAGLPVRPFAG